MYSNWRHGLCGACGAVMWREVPGPGALFLALFCCFLAADVNFLDLLVSDPSVDSAHKARCADGHN